VARPTAHVIQRPRPSSVRTPLAAVTTTAEQRRLLDRGTDPVPAWEKWGPYVTERSWGTVREDYSADGCAWDYA
jgi:hypothetical protein